MLFSLPNYRIIKRLFDVFFSLLLLLVFTPLILLLVLLSSYYTKQNGIFRQTRTGVNGRTFVIYKIRSITSVSNPSSSQMLHGLDSISSYGTFLRKYKLDELPQLINILLGDMSFVGPRPDVPSELCDLSPESRVFLTVKPGLTSIASLAYIDEEFLLSTQPEPLSYYKSFVFPDKVSLNCFYANNISFAFDFFLLISTVFAYCGLSSFFAKLRSH